MSDDVKRRFPWENKDPKKQDRRRPQPGVSGSQRQGGDELSFLSPAVDPSLFMNEQPTAHSHGGDHTSSSAQGSTSSYDCGTSASSWSSSSSSHDSSSYSSSSCDTSSSSSSYDSSSSGGYDGS